MILVIVIIIQTLNAAAFPRFSRRSLVGLFAAVGAPSDGASGGPPAALLTDLQAEWVAFQLHIVFGLAVAPRLLQAVGRWKVGHWQHTLNGLLCTGRCRWLTVKHINKIHKNNTAITQQSTCWQGSKMTKKLNWFEKIWSQNVKRQQLYYWLWLSFEKSWMKNTQSESKKKFKF